MSMNRILTYQHLILQQPNKTKNSKTHTDTSTNTDTDTDTLHIHIHTYLPKLADEVSVNGILAQFAHQVGVHRILVCVSVCV